MNALKLNVIAALDPPLLQTISYRHHDDHLNAQTPSPG